MAKALSNFGSLSRLQEATDQLKSVYSLSSAISYAQAAYDNINYYSPSNLSTFNSSYVSGRLSNGDYFKLWGSNLTSYPCTITELKYTFNHFGADTNRVSLVGSLSQANSSSGPSGYITNVDVWGDWGQVSVTGTDNVAVDNDGKITSVSFYSELWGYGEGVALQLTGNLSTKTSIVNGYYKTTISGIYTSATLIVNEFYSEKYKMELSGISVSAATAFTSADDFLKLALSGNDSISGRDTNDWLAGYSGNDTINGKIGADIMLGGAGNDTYYVDNTGDKVYETTTTKSSIDAGGEDTVYIYLNSYTLGNFVENGRLMSTGAANLTGNSASNILTGNAAANTLNGGTGADTMVGGLGNDTYVVDNARDVTTELASQGTDLVRSSVTYTLANNLENLTLTGSSAINATGNALANVLMGNSANNTLNGGLGTDTLYGGLGQDLLYGGSDTVRDVFDFNAVAESKVGSTRDKIYNFVTGKDDIDLSGIDANSSINGNQPFDFGGTREIANGVWYEKFGADLIVRADINGDKVSDMDIQIVGISKLVDTDFIL